MKDVDEAITQLKTLLHYDAENGVFTWKLRPWKKSKCRAGDIAGRIVNTQTGQHWYISSGNRSYNASMLAWAFTYGHLPDRRLKFLDGDSLNFRIANLELDIRMPRKRNGGALPKLNTITYERAMDQRLRYNYGISLETFNAMLLEQDGKCAVCRQPERTVVSGKVRPLCVDHDHTTGAVRSLLCTACNAALGHIGDSQEILRSMDAYLERHKRIFETPHEGNVIQMRKPA